MRLTSSNRAFDLGRKGHTLKDPANAKTWLRTTLYRRRRSAEIASFEKTAEMIMCISTPDVLPSGANVIDEKIMRAAILEFEERYRIAITLFYDEVVRTGNCRDPATLFAAQAALSRESLRA